MGAHENHPASGARIMVQYQPIGIALLITPWNYPLNQITFRSKQEIASH
jgi:succinate-semialdehyde dehydrogenase/glutarate-semialdehyde dehydrogenase